VTAKVGLRASGVDDVGSDISPLITYEWHERVYATNPTTGIAFAVSEVDASEVIAQRTA
jgi:hypothetical protein